MLPICSGTDPFLSGTNDIVRAATLKAKELGGELRPPELSWKYAWLRKAFGWRVAKNTAFQMREIRWSVMKSLDKTMVRAKAETRGCQVRKPTWRLVIEKMALR